MENDDDNAGKYYNHDKGKTKHRSIQKKKAGLDSLWKTESAMEEQEHTRVRSFRTPVYAYCSY